MGDSRNSANNGDMDPGSQDEGCFGDGENDAFFSSLYDTLEKGSSSSSPHLRRNLRFEFYGGEEWVETHLVVMAHWCENLPHVLLKGEDGGLVCGVPDSLGVTPASFRIFRKAIYLKRLSSRSLSLQERLEVRRLAEHFGCRMILQKCDDVEISLKNCHAFWDKWPEGSQVKEKALEMIKGNLKLFIDNNKCLEWSEKLWVTILSCKDLLPPLSTEDELFLAVLRWQDKNQDSVDVQKLRSLFKNLFQYPLMSLGLLVSTEFRESGILDHVELTTVGDEKRKKYGNEAINFSRPRGSPTTFPSGSQLMLLSSEEDPTTTRTSTALMEQGDGNVTWPVVISVSGNNGNIIRDEGTEGPPENENTTLTPTSISTSQDELDLHRRCISSGFHNPLSSSTAVVEDTVELPFVKTESIDECVEKSIQKSQKRSRNPSPSAAEEDDDDDDDWPFVKIPGKRKKICEHKRKSTQDSDFTNLRPITTGISPPSQTLKKKSVAKNFQELKHILSNASPGEEVELTHGVFDGQLKNWSLPEGVRIFGAGPSTIIRATGASKYIWWIICAGNNCTIEDMSFEKEGAHRKMGHVGLVVEKSDGVKIHNLSFLGCHLAVGMCDGADISDVTVESSFFGISLERDTKNAVVNNAKFKNLMAALTIHGISNTVSEIQCIHVERGVLIRRIGKTPCNGNTVKNLSYTFTKGEFTQTAVEIQGSEWNKVENVDCSGYSEIPPSAQKLANALWIIKPVKGSPLIPVKNVVKGVSGGPVWVGGKENAIQDVTDCPYLTAIGLRHHFTNCTVGKAYVESATDIEYTNCNFGPTTQTLTGGGDEGKS